VADAADDAQKLATNPEDSQYTLSNGTTGFSALHHQAKAEDEKNAAQTAKTQAETARNTAQNHRDDAQKLAIQAEDSQFTLTDGVTTGYSALHYSAKAQTAKTDAEAAASTTSGHITTTTQNASDSANAKADALKIASNAHNSQYTLADTTTTGYSALHYATEASNTLATFQGQYHGAAASDPTTNLDVGDIYFNTAGQLKVYSGTAWQNAAPSSSDQTNINTLAGISADITSLANAIGVSTTFVVTVAAGVFYIDGVANPTLTLDRGNTYIFDQSDSSNSGHPLAFKEGSSSYTTGVTVSGTAGQAGATVTIDVASNAPSSLLYYCTVHGNGMGNTISVVNSNLSLVASNITSVNTVANSTNLANITSVASDAADIGAVATNIGGTDTIGTVAANLTGTNTIGSVNGALTAINNVDAALTAINNVNTNLNSVNNFGDTYFVGSTAPSSPTSGDLWFDSSTGVDKLKVWDGTSFVLAGSTVNGTSERVSYIVGTTQGGYTGSTTVFPATYDVGFVDLYLNGIKLTPSDFTATNGTSITLASAASTNDTVDIVAYGQFVVANITTNSLTDVNSNGVTNGQVLAYNSTSGDFEPTTITVPPSDLVNDSSPQLGADLDANSNDILMGNQSVKFGTSKWEIVLDTADNDLNFKYNGTTVFKLSSAGAVVAADNISAFGTP
jgi:hypothetical protein